MYGRCLQLRDVGYPSSCGRQGKRRSGFVLGLCSDPACARSLWPGCKPRQCWYVHVLGCVLLTVSVTFMFSLSTTGIVDPMCVPVHLCVALSVCAHVTYLFARPAFTGSCRSKLVHTLKSPTFVSCSIVARDRCCAHAGGICVRLVGVPP